MDAFEMDELVAQRDRRGQPYYEFFRTTTLSLGLYVLPAGEQDRQLPHTEDEVYHVVEGKGMIQVDRRPPGDCGFDCVCGGGRGPPLPFHCRRSSYTGFLVAALAVPVAIVNLMQRH